ncbi:MAG: hypothetical protein IJ685_02130 [Selenomonadaceae bacterium]|nr:hypothetical protein [Selenomonadaceae bacterium]
MHKYIIEFDGDKIFSYAMKRGGNWFNWQILRPHGDLYYSAEKFSTYWNWFDDEIADDEIAICFVCPVEEISFAEKIIDAAPKFNCAQDSTWKLSELKKFFLTCHLDPTAKNFTYDETSSEIIFDCGQNFRLRGTGNFSLTDDIKPPEKIPAPKKFTVTVYSPVERKKISETVTQPINEPEKISANDIPPPVDAKEKVTAEELRDYLTEQTNGQCNTVSFKQ